MKPRGNLFTASDLAKFCEVDLKTIHNWADKGRIKHFRTPGRRLRFNRLDVLDFLRKWGYSVPAAVSQLGAKGDQGLAMIVVIEPDHTQVPALVEALKDSFQVRTFADFVEALAEMGVEPPEAMVIDSGANGSIDIIRMMGRTKRLEHVRCVAYSANLDGQQAALDAGAHDFIKKGDFTALKDSLMRILGLEREPS